MNLNRFSLFLLILCGSLAVAGCKKDKGNKVPVADAGPGKNITLPIDTETFTGTGTDEDGDIVAYLWSQVSGPAPTTIVNPGSPSTVIRGFQQGTYIFQLMVTDNDGATGVDTTKIIVSPNPIKTLTLQPANNQFEWQIAALNGANYSQSGAPDLPISAWTVQGQPIFVRGLVKFDLSAIPTNATIVSANLYLYSYPSPTLNGNFVDANFGSSNSLWLQQVTSNWSPSTVGWYNQPTYSTANQIVIPHTTQSQLDLNIDVKNMVSSMVANNANYGFGFRLQTEVTYNSRIFVSSYNTTHTSRLPKLVVVYQ
ncbi:MAG TPA: DNRLRE domain-containing protein [Chitinophagaceae bacterium]